jgi:hypothetical protein
MKKIKHIEDIQSGKMRLRIKQLELEKRIRNNWNELKEDLNPRIFVENKLAESTHQRPERGRLFSDALIYGINYISLRLSEIAGQKIESTMQKGVEKLAQKLKVGFSGKT